MPKSIEQILQYLHFTDSNNVKMNDELLNSSSFFFTFLNEIFLTNDSMEKKL